MSHNDEDDLFSRERTNIHFHNIFCIEMSNIISTLFCCLNLREKLSVNNALPIVIFKSKHSITSTRLSPRIYTARLSPKWTVCRQKPLPHPLFIERDYNSPFIFQYEFKFMIFIYFHRVTQVFKAKTRFIKVCQGK